MNKKLTMYQSRFIIYFLVIVAFGSCSQIGNYALKPRLLSGIDSLKTIYVPDSRVALWHISVKEKNNKVTVTGEVGDKEAQAALLNLKSKYPVVLFNIKLLPDTSETKTLALVNNSVSSIRRKTTRTSEMLTQALLGTPLKVFKKQGEWYYIQTPNHYLGWINKNDIVLFDTAELKNFESGKKIVFNHQYGFSYSKPDVNSLVVSDLVIGCILPVRDSVPDFYKVQYPDKRIGFVKIDEVENFKTLCTKKPVGEGLVKTALKFNGIPYLWGGFSAKAIDCSGFTSMVYFMNGVILQRDASQQTKYGKEITADFDFTNLQPGDLLFFGRKKTPTLSEKVTHVAIYIGDGEFIHASGRVRISSMDSTKENFIPSYPAAFVRAARMIGQENGTTIQQIEHNKFYNLLN